MPAAASPTSPSLVQRPVTQLARAALRSAHKSVQAAKLYTVLLERRRRRLSAWAEGTGRRAAGQFGFRRDSSTSQAAHVLRTLQDSYRLQAQRACDCHLWACFVDFKQVYDRVPRDRL